MTEPTPLYDQTQAALDPSTPTSTAVDSPVDNGAPTTASDPVITDVTTDDLDALIIAAGKELVAAQRARPRDQARIDAARDAFEQLRAQRDTAAP